jgi:hypothetical protein
VRPSWSLGNKPAEAGHSCRQAHNHCFRNNRCRRPIKMSPVCQLEMTLPWGFPGGVEGDGAADERWGAFAAGGAAGSGSAAVDDNGGEPTFGARAASGVLVVKGVPDRRSDRLNLETARPSQQPAQARGVAARGSDDHPPMVLGFWPDPCSSPGAGLWRPRSCARIMGSRLAGKRCANG